MQFIQLTPQGQQSLVHHYGKVRTPVTRQYIARLTKAVASPGKVIASDGATYSVSFKHVNGTFLIPKESVLFETQQTLPAKRFSFDQLKANVLAALPSHISKTGADKKISAAATVDEIALALHELGCPSSVEAFSFMLQSCIRKR